MRYLKSPLLFLVFSAFSLLSLPSARGEDASTGSQTGSPLSPELKTIGDFALFDSKGSVFALGRILVDFGSVYDVLAKYPEARGECPFRFVQYTDGRQGKPTLRKMRYFFRAEKSEVFLNSDVAGAEVQLEFDFDVSKTFLEGTIKTASSSGLKDSGTCKIRIK